MGTTGDARQKRRIGTIGALLVTAVLLQTAGASAVTVPTITSPAAGAVLTYANVTIEGTADPGSTIELSISTGGTLTTVTGASGSWSVSRNFSSTTHTVTAVAIDAGGHRSSPSPSRTFRVDLIDPAAPVIHTPGEGVSYRDVELSITGSAEPGATVTISEGAVIATTNARTDGTWSVVLGFAEGTHAISARATDQAGRVSPSSPLRSFVVDRTPPGVPSIGSPSNGSLVAENVQFTGRADPGARVELLPGDSGTSVAHAYAEDSGVWIIHRTLSHGEHRYRVRARDASGNVSLPSAERIFRVDADSPRVSVDTVDGTIYMPTQPTRITGTANDLGGVQAIEMRFYDLFERPLPYRYASCGTCPDGTAVSWVSSWSPPPGHYVVKIYAIDRVGHRSEPAVIRMVRT